MNTRSKIILILNSFLIMFAAYLVLHMVTTGLSALGAKWLFEIPSVLSRWGLKFTVPDSSRLWTHSSVIGIYIISPIVFVAAILFSLKKFWPRRFNSRTTFKFFWLWIYIHSFNLFFGGLGLGVILKKGIGYVPRWMGVPEPYIYIFSVVGFLLLAINGLIVNDYFSAYAWEEKQLIKVKDQSKFKVLFVVIPVLIFIIGNIAFGFPDRSLYSIGLHLGLLLPLPGIVFYHECLCDINERSGWWTRPLYGLLIAIGVGMVVLSVISVT